MKFVNRESELKFLEGHWRKNEAQLIIIYGKRRIGKTELCVQFAKDKRTSIFCARKQLPLFN